ncbi:MAG: HAMP domain-containing histidine kinase [Solirubrobacterales bacterium]|nr:HAMP domain-containing histidine kinase [Solirubrobacterales bacterium]
MGLELALSGWVLALAGLGALVRVRARLARHLDAVATACHELRGPLTAVRLGLEPPGPALQLPSARRRAIELELGRATLALDDLAALGDSPESIAGEARAELVDVAELCADCVEAWSAAAARRGVGLRLQGVRPESWVAAERLRLAQAVDNLLANAIEHGGGEIQVSLRSDPDSIRIEVIDGGPGLPAPVEELIRSRRRAGRGHGLAIVSGVAAAHGGRLITAPSQRGARMVLELAPARSLSQIVRL